MLEWLDIVCSAFILFFLLRGCLQGFWTALFKIVGLMAAWCAAVFGAPLAAGSISRATGWPSHLCLAAAGPSLAAACLLVTGVLVFLVRRRQKKRAVQGMRLSFTNRCAGAAIGCLCGVLVTAGLVWGYDLGRTYFTRLPDISRTYAARYSRPLVQRSCYFVLKSTTDSELCSKIISQLISSPETCARAFEKLSTQSSFSRMMASDLFRKDVLSGDSLRILENEQLQNVLNDFELLGQLRQMGIVPDDYKSDDFRARLADDLAGVGKRLKALPDSAALDFEQLKHQGLLKAENIKQLLLDPRILKLFSSLAHPGAPAPADT